MVPIQPPVANFTVDRDTIYQGESVVYKDLSTNEPVDFTWTFQNGIPATSKEQNPTIRYDKKGHITPTSQPATLQVVTMKLNKNS